MLSTMRIVGDTINDIVNGRLRVRLEWTQQNPQPFRSGFTLDQLLKTPKTLIIGKVQSGKTKNIIDYSMDIIETNLGDVLVLTRAITEDLIQITNRFQDEIRKRGHIVIEDSKDDNSSTFKFSNGLILKICIITPASLKKFYTTRTSSKDLYIAIDEFDAFDTSNTKEIKSLTEYKKIVSLFNVKHTLGVTATGISCFMKDSELTNENVFLLEPSSNYKGIGNLNFVINNGVFDTKYIKSIIYKITQNETQFNFTDCNGNLHPPIIFEKIEIQTKKQESRAIEYMRMSGYNKRYFQVMCNTNGTFIYSNIDLNLPSAIKNGIKYKFIKGTGIAVVLQELKDNFTELCNITPETSETERLDKIQKIPVIHVIGGKIFSRGVSIVSSDYNWHLTHEILYCSKTTDSTNLVQSIRLAGVYPDNIPLTLFTTDEIQKEIINYTTNQDDGIKKNLDDGCDSIISTLETMPICSCNTLKRNIGNNEKKLKMNVIYTPTQDDKNKIKQLVNKLKKSSTQTIFGKVFRLIHDEITVNRSDLETNLREWGCVNIDGFITQLTSNDKKMYHCLFNKNGNIWSLSEEALNCL